MFASFLHLHSAEFINSKSGFNGVYSGTGIFSFMPESLFVFALNIIMLVRFMKPEIYKDKKRVVSSSVLGVLLAFCSVWGQYVLYGTTLFDSSAKVMTALLNTIGFSIFTIPMTSEIIGAFCMAKAALAGGEGPGKFRIKNRYLYFFLTGLIAFLTYIPLFLFVWPMNFFGDSYDELVAQIQGMKSTHHTVIHGWMLRKAYFLGMKLGAPAYGFQLMTIFQMALMAFAIAFFMLYLYDRKVSAKLRMILFLVCIVNPANDYFAVTAEKGTMGISLAMCGLVCLMRLLDLEQQNVSIKNREWILNAAGYIVFSSAGCLFRNNMVYAFLLGGIVISVLRSGVKKKLIMLAVTLLLFGSYKAENTALIRIEGSRIVDTYRETLPLPIMCLARAAILHGDEIPEEKAYAIRDFIPQEALDNYAISNADSVKNDCNEGELSGRTGEFISLFIEMGLKYPGDYLDQFAWLTYGYWNPYHAFVLQSTAAVIVTPLPEMYADVENKCLNPWMEDYFIKIYCDNGRFKMPLLSWFFRGTIYFWSVLFLLICGMVWKNRRMISLAAVPFFYLVTVLAGPLCQFRYIYFNILTLPLVLYALAEGLGEREESGRK